MQKSNRRLDQDAIIYMAARAGALGILICLLFAVAVLLLQGNPVLLLALLGAVAVVVLFVRRHLDWLATMERMRTQEGAHSAAVAQLHRLPDVEDVVFHEVPLNK